MAQNKGTDDPQHNNETRTSTGAGTGATDAGTTRDTSLTRTASGTGAAAATASDAGQNISAQAQQYAQQYGQKVADAATQAKDYVADKLSVVGDKFKDLQNKDINQVAEEAKQYARQNPGQAILISAAAGLVVGLLLRGSRR